ncbi:MAG: hypothetical protein JNM89_15035 [Hyphomicrobiaceae bacterium]|nr:hypothetical protein [Hyphomicrobiaceae bacterium]
MRVPSLLLSASFAALAATGCASPGYDHREEIYRAEQAYRPHRGAEKPRRVASSKTRTRQAKAETESKRERRSRSEPSELAATSPRLQRSDPPRTQASKEAVKDKALPATTIAKAPAPAEPPAIPPSVTPPPAAPPANAAAPPPAGPVTTSALATPANAAPVPAAKPAAAPQPVAPSAADEAQRGQPAPDPAARKEIADGYRLLRAGFVKKARERFELARSSAPGEATLADARSMDPTYLSSVAFPDVQPDAEQARRLYRRAIMLGSAEAKADLDRLEGSAAIAAPSPQPDAARPQ